MTETQARARVSAYLTKNFRRQLDAAREFDVSVQFINALVKQKKQLPAWALEAAGLERSITYKRAKKG